VDFVDIVDSVNYINRAVSHFSREHHTVGKRSDSGPVPPGEKAVRLSLTPEVQQKLRMAAAAEGMSMAAYARKIVTEAVEHGTKKGGAK